LAFYLALRLGLFLAHLVPARVFIGATAQLFRAGARLSPAYSRVARNLAAMRGVLPAGVPAARTRPDDVFESYGRYWGELLAQAARPERDIMTPLRIEGRERLDEARARGSVCFLTGHLGNWDLLARWTSAQVGGLTVLAETLRPPGLPGLFVRLREAAGCRVLPAESSGLKLYRHWRRGGHCGLVADRVFGAGQAAGGSREVDFLGGRRRFPSSGMDLARRAGASLVPIFLLREKGGYAIKVHPPLPEGEDPVAAFAKALAREIQARPEQWCVLYPLHDAGDGARDAGEAPGGAARAAAIPSGIGAKGRQAP